MDRSTQGRRAPVTEAPPLSFGSIDYVDAFEIGRAESDTRTAEECARRAFDRAPLLGRLVVLFVHRRVLGFDLGPWSSPDHVIGWQVITSAPDVIRLRAQGRLMLGHLVVRASPLTVTVTTFLHYNRRPGGSAAWAAVGPFHRFLAPHVLSWGSVPRPR